MKIISYNLNGIRSAISKGLFDWLAVEQPDVFCIQESKAQPDQIDVMTMQELGYQSYIHSAEKKGYSGVAIFTRIQPDRVVVGMSNPKYDCQGRVIRADYGDVTVICVYIPSGEAEGPKYEYKMDFLADFLVWINELRKERPNIVVCGDYNIAHKPIDINNWKRQVGVSGFLPEERAWLDQLFIVFRVLILVLKNAVAYSAAELESLSEIVAVASDIQRDLTILEKL